MHYDFIQIGSHVGKTENDPVNKLIEDGAKGILIEPVPYLFQKLKRNYKEFENNLVFINKAVSNKKGHIELFVPSDDNNFDNLPWWTSQLASVDENHATAHIPDLIMDSIRVETVTLDEIISECGVSSLTRLFSDTEGHDYEILMSLDFSVLRPLFIQFENKHMDGTFSRSEKYRGLIKHFNDHGYEVDSENAQDTSLISSEKIARSIPLVSKIKELKRTMVRKERLVNLNYWCRKLQNSGAAFVECGVAQGGCLSLMSHWGQNVSVFGFDSFQGMPDLTAEDEGSGTNWIGFNCSRYGVQAVSDTFELLGVDVANTSLVEGYFEDTLESNVEKIGPISVLRLDNDWYRSTKYCLETLYDSVIPGGVIIVDDYGTFLGCRKAVDEFRTERAISSPLIVTDKGGEYYWVKRREFSNQRYYRNKEHDQVLIYLSIFDSVECVALLNMFLLSLCLNKGKIPFKILLQTDKKLKVLISKNSLISLFDHDYQILQGDWKMQISTNRLRVFEYSLAEKYNEFLYLDMNNLITGDIDELLALRELLFNDKLTAKKEGSVTRKHWGGTDLFSNEELEGLTNLDGISSGVMMFRNHPRIQELFGSAINEMGRWRKSKKNFPTCLGQPFINKVAAVRNQREIDLLDNAVSLTPHESVQIITKIRGNMDNPIQLKESMRNYFRDVITPVLRDKSNSWNEKQEQIIGRRYHWMHDRITTNGFIEFAENGVLKNSWKDAHYAIKGPNLVLARWGKYDVYLIFDDDAENLISIRFPDLHISEATLRY